MERREGKVGEGQEGKGRMGGETGEGRQKGERARGKGNALPRGERERSRREGGQGKEGRERRGRNGKAGTEGRGRRGEARAYPCAVSAASAAAAIHLKSRARPGDCIASSRPASVSVRLARSRHMPLLPLLLLLRLVRALRVDACSRYGCDRR